MGSFGKKIEKNRLKAAQKAERQAAKKSGASPEDVAPSVDDLLSGPIDLSAGAALLMAEPPRPVATYAEALAATEEFRAISGPYVDILREFYDRTIPYAGLAREAVAEDVRRPAGRSFLALYELISAAEPDLYTRDAWEGRTDFATRLYDVIGGVQGRFQASGGAANRDRILRSNQQLMDRSCDENPLMGRFAYEAGGTEEVDIAARTVFSPNPVRAYLELRKHETNPYRTMMREVVSRAMQCREDLLDADAPEADPQIEERAYEHFNFYQWQDVIPPLDREVIARKVLRPKDSSFTERHFGQAQAAHTFNIPYGSMSIRVSFLRPRPEYLDYQREQQLLDPLLNLRIEVGGHVMPAELSRLTGNICPPLHSTASLRPLLGETLHNTLRDRILVELDRYLHPEQQSTTLRDLVAPNPEASSSAVEHDEAAEHIQPAPLYTGYVPSASGASQEDAPQPQTVEKLTVRLPDRMRIGEVIRAIRRCDPSVSVRTGGKHPVLMRTVGEHTYSHTMLNEHEGDMSLLFHRIISNVIETLHIDPIDFLRNARGAQAKELLRQIER